MKFSELSESVKRPIAYLSGRFDRKDLPAAAMVLGLILLGYGASQISHGYGPLVVGLALVVNAKPLSRWVK